jgi:nitrogenase molybdenum-iron protein alpha chain
MIAWGGESRELVDITSRKCAKDRNRSFTQATFCQEWLAMVTLATIKDIVIVSHAPVGCVGSMTFISMFNNAGQKLRMEPLKNGNWISTNLTEHDVVHGATEKLENTVRAAYERYNSKAIFIYSSCVSGVIGEDIDSSVEKLNKELDIPVAPVYCEGFKSKLWATGYDGSFQGALNYIIKEPKKKQENLINVINPISFSRLDELEIKRLLDKINVEVNYIPNFNTIDNLARASEAALTSTLCTTFSEYLAKQLKERYDVPYTEKIIPTGLDNTDAWLREVGEYLNKEDEVEELIKSERARVQPKIDKIKEKLEGKTAFISAGQVRALGIANIIADLGMKLEGLTAFHYDEVIHEGFEELTNKCGNFCTHIANAQPFEQTNILHNNEVDFYIGHMGETVLAAKQGIPTAMVCNLFRLFLGYDGVLSFGERILNVQTNPLFNKTLANSKPIYKDSWLKEDPFKYQK